MRRRAGWPVRGSEVDTPKMRARRKKFHSDSRAFFRSVAQIDHSTLLFFLSYGINQHEICAKCEFRLNVEQASVSIDHDRLAIFSEFAAVDAHVCLVSCMANDQESTITPSKVPKNTG